MPNDENKQVDGQPTESSAENKTEEKTIPYERFQEVNEKFRASLNEQTQLKTDLQSIREELESLKLNQTEPEEELDWSNLTPKQFEERITAKTLKKIENEQKTLYKEQQLRDQEIAKSFAYLKQLGHNITEKTERDVLNKMIMTGSNDVLATYIENQAEFVRKTENEQIKQGAFVPFSSKGADIQMPAFTYDSIRGKSLMDFVS